MNPKFYEVGEPGRLQVLLANLEQARLSVFKYIETFYNPVRLHQTLGYLSPEQYETDNAPVSAA